MASEQDINDLVYELKNLTRAINEKGMSGGQQNAPTSDPAEKVTKSVDKMVIAIGMLTTHLDSAKKSSAKREREVEDFNKAVEKATERIEEKTAAEKKAQKEAKDADEKKKKVEKEALMSTEELLRVRKKETEEIEKANKLKADKAREELQDKIREAKKSHSGSAKMWDDMSSAGDATQILKAKFFDLAGDSVVGQMGLRLLGGVAEGAAKGISTFTSAIYKGERGASVAAKALTDFSTPIINAIESISTFAVAIATFASFIPGPIGALTRLGRFAIGAAGGVGLLGAAAAKAAVKFQELAAEQADRLFKSFNELGKAGGVSAGGLNTVFSQAQKLGFSMSQIEEYNRLMTSSQDQLRMFAGTTTKGRKAFADVAGELVHSPIGESLEMLGITAEDQREATLQFMTLQNRMGRDLTKNTKELIDGSAQFNKELDLSAQLTGAQRKEQMAYFEFQKANDRLRAAEYDATRRNDKVALERIGKAKLAGELAYGMGDKTGATGILNMGASGVASTPEAVAAMQSYNLNKLFASGGPTTRGGIFGHMSGAATQSMNTFGGVNAVIGGIGSAQTNIGALSDFALKYPKMLEDAKKAGFDDIDKFLEAEQRTRMAGDEDSRSMVETRRKQQEAAETMDSVVKTYNGAATLSKKASDVFAEAVGLFARTVRADKPELGYGGVQGGPAHTGPAAAHTPAMARAVGRSDRNLEAAATLEDQAKAIANDPNATAEQKAAARKAADEAAAQSAREGYMLHGQAMRERNARRMQRRQAGAAAPSGAPSSSAPSAPSGAPSSSAPSAPAAPSGAPPSGAPASPSSQSKSPLEQATDQVKQAGLKIRGWGDVYQGGPLTEKGLSVAQAIQNSIEGFGMFTGLNDQYHKEKHPRSTHVAGRGIDFTMGRTPTVEEAKEIKKKLLGISGVAGVKNEYYDPPHGDKNQFTTGPHFHVDAQARTGGIFKGPSTGYNVTLHDEEIVVPASDGVSKQALNSSVFGQSSQGQDKVVALLETMIDRYDTMIDLLDDGNDHSQKLVRAMA